MQMTVSADLLMVKILMIEHQYLMVCLYPDQQDTYKQSRTYLVCRTDDTLTKSPVLSF